MLYFVITSYVFWFVECDSLNFHLRLAWYKYPLLSNYSNSRYAIQFPIKVPSVWNYWINLNLFPHWYTYPEDRIHPYFTVLDYFLIPVKVFRVLNIWLQKMSSLVVKMFLEQSIVNSVRKVYTSRRQVLGYLYKQSIL